MRKHIGADPKFDKSLDEVIFSDMESKFELSLVFISSNEKVRLERIINALIASTSGVLNFDIDASDDKAIKVVGNILEALEVLKKQKVISSELYTHHTSKCELQTSILRRI